MFFFVDIFFNPIANTATNFVNKYINFLLCRFFIRLMPVDLKTATEKPKIQLWWHFRTL